MMDTETPLGRFNAVDPFLDRWAFIVNDFTRRFAAMNTVTGPWTAGLMARSSGPNLIAMAGCIGRTVG